MKIIYKVTENEIVSVEADTGDFCYVSSITRLELRERAQAVLDGKKNLLWSDGHLEEPATRLYAALQKGTTKIEEIHDLDRLCFYINEHGYVYYEITVEDNLL